MTQESATNIGCDSPVGECGLYLAASPLFEPTYLMQFCLNNRTLVTIFPDCTVEVAEGTTLDEASRLFWDQVRIEGKTLRQRAEDAEARLAASHTVNPQPDAPDA